MKTKSIAILISIFIFLYVGAVTAQQILPGDTSSNLSDLIQDIRNQVHLRLGTDLGQTVRIDDKNTILAIVNGETISLSEFNYSSTFEVSKAKEMGCVAPDKKAIFRDLVERKCKVAAARQVDMYPSDDEITDYVVEQRKLMDGDGGSDVKQLLTGWGISTEDYFSLMRGTWADSIAIERWYSKTITEKVGEPNNQEDFTAYTERATNLYNEIITELIDKSTIQITETGKVMGLAY